MMRKQTPIFSNFKHEQVQRIHRSRVMHSSIKTSGMHLTGAPKHIEMSAVARMRKEKKQRESVRVYS